MPVWVLLLTAVSVIQADNGEQGRTEKVALFIIDVQDCFLKGGSLAVPDGEQVIPVINKIRRDFNKDFSLVVRSQDWHCWDHVSFASQHPGMEPFSSVNLTYNSQGMLCYGPGVSRDYPYAETCVPDPEHSKVLSQTLWPDHCIEFVTSGPTSAQFSPLLDQDSSDVIIRKGYRCWVDSYSAFFDNGGFTHTELDSVLKQYDIGVVVVTGLALDYCVYFTSMDGHKLGYKVVTVTDASRGVDSATTAAAMDDMKNAGIILVTAAELRDALHNITTIP